VYKRMRPLTPHSLMRGVPFFIRAGKHLPVTATEVFVTLKRPPWNMYSGNRGIMFDSGLALTG